jgi:S-adenosylmethionine synthetase
MIVIERLKGRSVSDQGIEIVERKGTGHPDFMCDAIMESISVALSREYRNRFGTVLHHNIDKGLISAGKTLNSFGGGSLIKPMEIIIGDRATFAADGRKIAVKKIAVSAAKEWIRNNLRYVDPERHVAYRVVLAEGSAELTDIFRRTDGVRGANDTSALIGFYPLSATEKTVLSLERYLNSREFKKRYPETGEDVKVMGLRKGRMLQVTVAMPLLSGFITSEDEYFSRKEIIRKNMGRFLRGHNEFESIEVIFNALDSKGRGLNGVYLSLLGTSAEGADSGQVGRGNRVNGLISINRPMGTEAAAGKNPVSHVGKIYNILAHKTAEKIYKNVDSVNEVYVMFLSRIGAPINEPPMVSVQVRLKEGVGVSDVSRPVTLIMESELSDISQFCENLADGLFPVC